MRRYSSMMKCVFFSGFFFFVWTLAGGAEVVDYAKGVLPIMKEHCWDCHSNEKSVKGSRVPRPGSDAWSRAALIFPHLSERSYKEHLVLLGVMEGVSFYFQKFERLLKGVKFDRALASMPEIDSGILVLTYHHHFNILLCAFLGRLLNRPLNILAMDPDLSPLAKPVALSFSNGCPKS